MAKKSAPIIRNLEREAEAAKNLVVHMATILGEDSQDESQENEQLHHDMIEGETDLLKVIDHAIEHIAMDTAHIEGLGLLAKKIADRKERKKMRIDTMRAAIKTALDISGLDRHEGPLATLSVGLNPIKLIVTEESMIDSKFFKIPDPLPPELQSKELLAYLKAQREAFESLADIPEAERETVKIDIMQKFPAIAGVELSNQDTRLNVRFK